MDCTVLTGGAVIGLLDCKYNETAIVCTVFAGRKRHDLIAVLRSDVAPDDGSPFDVIDKRIEGLLIHCCIVVILKLGIFRYIDRKRSKNIVL
jgi:hypothetical protein